MHFVVYFLFILINKYKKIYSNTKQKTQKCGSIFCFVLLNSKLRRNRFSFNHFETYLSTYTHKHVYRDQYSYCSKRVFLYFSKQKFHFFSYLFIEMLEYKYEEEKYVARSSQFNQMETPAFDDWSLVYTCERNFKWHNTFCSDHFQAYIYLDKHSQTVRIFTK